MKRIVSSNLSAENDLLRLPREDDIGCVLGGGGLLYEDQSPDGHELLLDSLILQVQGYRPDIRHWLLAGHNTWQPDTRIVRYNQLWRSLSKRVSLPLGPRSEEFLIESNEGLKFFGILECTNLETRSLSTLLNSERACFLVATWGDYRIRDIEDVVRHGWSAPLHSPPMEILRLACIDSIVIYSQLGRFDDREQGWAIVGQPRWVDGIFGRP